MRKIVTIREIVVEVMATERGTGFLEPVALVGPFPSGAPAIFIDQCGRLGQPCGMVGRVGDDDFGRLNLRRLAADGVDVSAVSVDPEAAAAVDAPMARLGDRPIPGNLVSQYLPRLIKGVRDGSVRPTARDLTVAAIRLALQPYGAACST